MLIEEWLHPDIFKKKVDYSKEFKTAKPFEHICIFPFLKEEKIKELQKALEKEEFYLEDNDLYQFLRTIDFKQLNNPVIQEFRNFIFSKEFTSFMSTLTSESLSQHTGSLHSLLLTQGHYLLPHDDRVENRSIAFILYLCEKFNTKDGGSLDLFNSENNLPTNVSKSLYPKFNQFICFKVSPKSFHQISEVETSKQRLSISGWLYK